MALLTAWKQNNSNSQRANFRPGSPISAGRSTPALLCPCACALILRPPATPRSRSSGFLQQTRGGNDDTGSEDPRPQASVTFQELFGTHAERLIHPVTRPAFTGASKTNALQFELLPDQAIQIHTAS